MKRLFAILVVLALLAAACGADDGTGDTIVTTTPSPTTTVPAPSDRLLLQISEEGGFAPIEFLINRVPSYTLYADGTLLAPGVLPAIFPGPILSPVQQIQLSTDDLGDVMTLIDAIGLPAIDRAIDDALTNRVVDATTTVVSYIDANGHEHVYGAYALGLVMDEPLADATVGLGALRDLMDGFVRIGGAEYEADRLQLHLNDTPFADPNLSATLPWPLEPTPDDFEPAGTFNSPCHVLYGEAARAAIAAFEGANQATLWDFGGTEYQILARPLLPGEPGC